VADRIPYVADEPAHGDLPGVLEFLSREFKRVEGGFVGLITEGGVSSASLSLILSEYVTSASLSTEIGLSIQPYSAVMDVQTAGAAGTVFTSNGSSVAATFQAAGGGGGLSVIEIQINNLIRQRNTGITASMRGIAYCPAFGWVVCGPDDGSDGEIWLYASSSGLRAGPWTEQANPKALDLFGAAASAVAMVLVGESTGADDAYILRSTNGTVWAEQNNPSWETLRFVHYSIDEALFIAVGDRNAGGYAYIATSAIGSTWSDRTHNPIGHLYGVIYGDGIWVAVGEAYGGTGSIISSSNNGVSWTRRACTTTSDLNAVAWGGGVFVAIGDGSRVHTSPDGVTFTYRASLSGDVSLNFNAIIYVDGLFIAGAATGEIYISADDGVTWTKKFSPTTNYSMLAYDVHSHSSQLMGVGSNVSASASIVMSSIYL